MVSVFDGPGWRLTFLIHYEDGLGQGLTGDRYIWKSHLRKCRWISNSLVIRSHENSKGLEMSEILRVLVTMSRENRRQYYSYTSY